MRSYQILALIFALLSVTAYAQTTTISVSLSQDKTIQLNTPLGNQYPVVYAYLLPDQQIIDTIEVEIERYKCGCPYDPRGGQCYFWLGGPAVPCGDLQLCISLDQDPRQYCQPINDMNHQQQSNRQTLTFDIDDTLAQTIRFIASGISATTRDYDFKLIEMTYIGGSANQEQYNIFSFRNDEPVKLKRVNEFIDTKGAVEDAYVTSSDPRVAVWFSPEGGQAPKDRTRTAVYEDFVYACLNLDAYTDPQTGQPVCDYEDEEICAQQGKDWYDGYCCGNYPYNECKWYGDKNAFCGERTVGGETIKTWAALGDKGLITTLDVCPGIEVVSDGSTFHSCTQPPTTPYVGPTQVITDSITIEGHDYRCENSHIVECGGDAPFNDNAKLTGDTATINNQTHYCSASGQWKTSLDGDEDTCKAAGLAWTGSRCCGEPDDTLITYTEQGGNGICKDNTYTPSGSFVEGKEIIAYDGLAYQCDPQTAAPRQTQYNGLPVIATPMCGQPLEDARTTGALRHLICEPTGEWKFISSTEPHLTKTTEWTPQPNEQEQGCCPDDQCWDGNTCRNIGEYYTIGGTGYLCQ